MPYLKYESHRFKQDKLTVIQQAEEIIQKYLADGYDLTLRQLYYQFVARDIFPEDHKWSWTGARWIRDPNGTKNADPNYTWLGDIMNDARLAGMIDWDSIVDRTRHVRKNSHWDSPRGIVESCAQQFRIDTRKTQEKAVEVWIEKDALIGVIEGVCQDLDVPCFSCRGYVSQSTMWDAAYRRLIPQEENGKQTYILHLGDHDPSGIDMTRDIQDRLHLFESDVIVERIALTMEQVDELNPPPNPAKLTDSRCRSYMDNYGDESWELDALEPDYIVNLIQEKVAELTDFDEWEKQQAVQDEHRKNLKKIAKKLD